MPVVFTPMSPEFSACAPTSPGSSSVSDSSFQRIAHDLSSQDGITPLSTPASATTPPSSPFTPISDSSTATARTVRRTKKRSRTPTTPVETLGMRLQRFVLTVVCFLPLVYLTQYTTMATMGVWISIGCVGVAALREILNIPSFAGLYPVFAVAAGVLTARSFDHLREDRMLRLTALSVHAVLAGQLRGRMSSTRGGKAADELTLAWGYSVWFCIGLCGALITSGYSDILRTLGAFGLVACIPVIAAVLPQVVTSMWIRLFGQEKASSRKEGLSLLRRSARVLMWGFTAFTPLLIILISLGCIMYMMLPLVWNMMVLVEPVAIFLEIRSSLSVAGQKSLSLFYCDNPNPKKALAHGTVA